MTKKKKFFIPEEHFKDVPDKFSSESHFTNVKSTVRTNGIILDNIEEVEFVLRTHNGEKIFEPLACEATFMDLFMNMSKAAGPLGGGLALLAKNTMMKDKDFVGTMVAEAKCNIASKGKYHRSYDYDGMGSNFLKTSVDICSVQGKFVLSICAAYVGKKPEEQLAILLKIPVALSSIDILASISAVDEWWYNLNIKKTLGDIGYLDNDFEPNWPEIAQAVANEEYSFTLPLLRKGVPIDLKISTNYSYHPYKNEAGELKNKTMTRAIGENIAGASWEPSYRDNELAKRIEKNLILSLSFANQRFNSPPVIDPGRTRILAMTATEIEAILLKKVSFK